VLELHPFPGNHEWNSFTGSSDGRQDVRFDLSDYAGEQVELSISYVADPVTGVWARSLTTPASRSTVWRRRTGSRARPSVGGPPADSPPNSGNWQIGERVQIIGGASTEEILLLGFGVEQLATPQERADLVGRALGGPID
jgi:hypothetical protein